MVEFLFNYQTQSHDSDSLELLHLLWSRQPDTTTSIIPEITCGRKVIVLLWGSLLSHEETKIKVWVEEKLLSLCLD